MIKYIALTIIACFYSANTFAASYQIFFPDNEKKEYVFTDDKVIKNIGKWTCVFSTDRTKEESSEFYIIYSECHKAQDVVQVYEICSTNNPQIDDPLGGNLKIFSKDNKKWVIKIKCN